MKKISFILAMLIFSSFGFNHQERIVTGKVTSANDGQPIPGVNVTLKNTVRSTVTDAKGTYKIGVPHSGGILVFSFIGYKTQEIKIFNKDVINVKLSQDKTQLSEVVVTGYGQKHKSNRGIPSDSEMSESVQGTSYSRKSNSYINYSPADNFQNFNTEEYDHFNENIFHDPVNNPLSTFSIDVDAASYSNMRRFLNNGQLPPEDAVRIEEMVNYFVYQYNEPSGDHPFSIITEYSEAPWNESHKLVHIGLQVKKLDYDDIKPSNLVFLVDVSGSMRSANKLPLLKSSLKMLVNNLDSRDRVAIVAYAGAAGLVLPSTPASDKATIIAALDRLKSGGSTAGGAGIKLAYKVAKDHLIEDGNNRVILATDGDFNVGVSSTGELVRMIEEKRKDGIFLTITGFGMGNYKDGRMEQISNAGNGNYYYIDNIKEARKVFITEMRATLFTIAKDVKIQVEFNPGKVQAYRLLGYENRMLKSEDFNDDKKDAGELGAGHTVTALYEIIPVGVESEFIKNIDDLKYQKLKNTRLVKSEELLTVKFRYKKPDGDKSRLIVQTVMDEAEGLHRTSDNFRWSAAVAEFGMLLRDSEFKSNASYSQVLELAEGSKGHDKEGYRAEFIQMVRTIMPIASR